MADITYILNDPSTPSLMIPVTLQSPPAYLDFKVDGFRGATSEVGTLEHQAACCYFTLINGINLVNSILETPIQRWATVPVLYVQPRAGKQFNAFYDRQALRFFYGTDPVAGKVVYTVNSVDIVAHEFGHAILDAIRPDLFNMQAMEVWSYHESFGDQNAILNLLAHPEICNYIIQETNGDLKLSNIVSRLAEEFGAAIFNVTGGKMGHSVGSLRNAVNSFKYTPPESLPRQGLDTQLTCEPHSFSRVFTGAWYDILVAIYEKEKTAGKPAIEALSHAYLTMATYTYRALRLAPATIRFYDAVARAMLIVDKANNYAYNSEMNQVFIARGILREVIRPLVSFDWTSFAATLVPSDEVFQHTSTLAVRNKNTQTIPLPYYMMTVEAPGDTLSEFNTDGTCVNIITTSGFEIVNHVHECVAFLKEKDMIRPDEHSPFELTNEGLLIRSHFACGCGCKKPTTTNCATSTITRNTCNDNAYNPQEPEYNKPWKSANNAGCCGSCHTIAPCGTEPPDLKGLLPSQHNYIKTVLFPGPANNKGSVPLCKTT